jgi:hypothetical protein
MGPMEYRPTLMLDMSQLGTLNIPMPAIGQTIGLECDATVTGINACGDPDDASCVNVTFELSNITLDNDTDEDTSMEAKAAKLYPKGEA